MRSTSLRPRRRLRRRSRAAPEVRRRAILDGARQVLLRQGLHGLTMDEVARAAGVAKGTVYLYFPSKGELVAGLRREYNRELVEQAGDLLGPLMPAEPAVQRMESAAGAMFDFFVEH